MQLDLRGRLTKEQATRWLDRFYPGVRDGELQAMGDLFAQEGFMVNYNGNPFALERRFKATEHLALDLFDYHIGIDGTTLFIVRPREHEYVRSVAGRICNKWLLLPPPAPFPWSLRVEKVHTQDGSHAALHWDIYITFIDAVTADQRQHIWRHLSDVLQSAGLFVMKVNGDDAPDGLHISRMAEALLDQADIDWWIDWNDGRIPDYLK